MNEGRCKTCGGEGEIETGQTTAARCVDCGGTGKTGGEPPNKPIPPPKPLEQELDAGVLEKIKGFRTSKWDDIKAGMRPEVRQAAEGRVEWALQRCARPTCGHQRIDHSHGIMAPDGLAPRDIPADLPLIYSSTPTLDGKGACLITCGCREFQEPANIVEALATDAPGYVDTPHGLFTPHGVIGKVRPRAVHASQDPPDDRWFVRRTDSLAAEGAFHTIFDALKKANECLAWRQSVYLENEHRGVRLTLDPQGARPDDWDNPKVATPHLGPDAIQEFKYLHRGGIAKRPIMFYGTPIDVPEMMGPGTFFAEMDQQEMLTDAGAAPSVGDTPMKNIARLAHERADLSAASGQALAREGGTYAFRPVRNDDRTRALQELANRALLSDRREGESIPDGLTLQWVNRANLVAQVFLKAGDRKCRLSVFADGRFELNVIDRG